MPEDVLLRHLWMDDVTVMVPRSYIMQVVNESLDEPEKSVVVRAEVPKQKQRAKGKFKGIGAPPDGAVPLKDLVAEVSRDKNSVRKFLARRGITPSVYRIPGKQGRVAYLTAQEAQRAREAYAEFNNSKAA
jgi:hypothetical protein